MRTTIEFDPDLATELEHRRRHGGRTLKDDVNGLVRLGLAHEREQARAGSAEPFRTPTFDTGPPLVAIDDVASALRVAEGEDHR